MQMMVQNKKWFYGCLLVIVLLVGFSSVVLAEEDRNNSLIVGISRECFVNVEYERQLTEHIDVFANYGQFVDIFDLIEDGDLTMYSLGISYYPLSSSMQGLYIGAGFTHLRLTGSFFGIDLGDPDINGGVVTLGYKKIYNSGIAFNIGVQGVFTGGEAGAIPSVALGFSW
jgi:hypothetical protein